MAFFIEQDVLVIERELDYCSILIDLINSHHYSLLTPKYTYTPFLDAIQLIIIFSP